MLKKNIKFSKNVHFFFFKFFFKLAGWAYYYLRNFKKTRLKSLKKINFSNLFLFLWGLNQRKLNKTVKTYNINYIYNFYINSAKYVCYFI